ncbi:hypothetical protein BDZ89DRAFT_1163682 [Hymenopellis radicata]|nr:hypothetical protein BDZ89DRAFT_1163682 [Hymenopellis radicata]
MAVGLGREREWVSGEEEWETDTLSFQPPPSEDAPRRRRGRRDHPAQTTSIDTTPTQPQMTLDSHSTAAVVRVRDQRRPTQGVFRERARSYGDKRNEQRLTRRDWAQCLELLNIFTNGDDADQRVEHAADNCQAGGYGRGDRRRAGQRPQGKASYLPNTNTRDFVTRDALGAGETDRKTITQTYGDAHAQVQGVDFVHPRVDCVKSLISPTEPVTPGILYIGITTLSGSVFACMRAPPLQARR